MRLFIESAAAALALALFPLQPSPFAQDTWRAEAEAHQKRRDSLLRDDPFSPLALVHREYLDGRAKLTIGSGEAADLRLLGWGVAPMHATVEIDRKGTILRAERNTFVEFPLPSNLVTSELDLVEGTRFRIGRNNLLYRADAPVRGAAIEVYNTEEPALKEFRGLEFFPIDARYRVQAEITPRATPPQVQLIDSAGQPRPYYIYGDLRFTLDGQTVTMEVYSTTLDRAAIERGGFMLIFSDATSGADAAGGKESYYAGRYLDIDGKFSGPVAVDFNLARNPPCAFSPVYTCPFPRAQNKLAVAIRAGEKAYRGKTATPLQPL